MINQNLLTGIVVLSDGQSQMIARKDVLNFAERLLKNNYEILGIEGFFFDGESLRPDMDCIVDFSGQKPSNDLITATIREALSDRVNFVEFVVR